MKALFSRIKGNREENELGNLQVTWEDDVLARDGETSNQLENAMEVNVWVTGVIRTYLMVTAV